MSPGRKGPPFSFFPQSFRSGQVGCFVSSSYLRNSLSSFVIMLGERDLTDAEGSLLTKPPTREASRQKEATRKRSCRRSPPPGISLKKDRWLSQHVVIDPYQD
ncbi:hypothetical protein Syun_031984 [Stephania yunnanensis]|uniref:Uncharacterized protein n=1 Tax=Stephania yunnanensis TaxID=152371 RepID=A0AAP0HF79_9MAGN